MPTRGEKDLNENVGSLDRVIRVVGGIILLGVSIFKLKDFWHLFFGFFGIYGIVTGTFRICLIYRILGKNTARG